MAIILMPKTSFCKTTFWLLSIHLSIPCACMKKIPSADAFPFAILNLQSSIALAMQCEHCDNKATVFYTQIIDGIGKKSCLCESCANEQGITDPDGFLLGSQDIQKKGDSSKPKALPKIEVSVGKPSDRCCTGCGFAFEDLKKTGRLGCSECYDFFRDEIKNNLGGMHKGTSHTGRVPAGMLEAFKERQELEKLEEKLSEAISSEDYEKAAALRDEMSKITSQDSTPPEQQTKP
jgi:protein arginine kinase activator